MGLQFNYKSTVYRRQLPRLLFGLATPPVQTEAVLRSRRFPNMADPLSITGSVLAVLTTAVHSVKLLAETVNRYEGRDKTLSRLQTELEDFVRILDALHKVVEKECSMIALLKDPILRCSQLCNDFEKAMKTFSGKSKVGFRDWAKMEFMRGDINDFLDALSGYKETISIGLGTVTMLVTHPVDLCNSSSPFIVAYITLGKHLKFLRESSRNTMR